MPTYVAHHGLLQQHEVFLCPRLTSTTSPTAPIATASRRRLAAIPVLASRHRRSFRVRSQAISLHRLRVNSGCQPTATDARLFLATVNVFVVVVVVVIGLAIRPVTLVIVARATSNAQASARVLRMRTKVQQKPHRPQQQLNGQQLRYAGHWYGLDKLRSPQVLHAAHIQNGLQ